MASIESSGSRPPSRAELERADLARRVDSTSKTVNWYMQRDFAQSPDEGRIDFVYHLGFLVRNQKALPGERQQGVKALVHTLQTDPEDRKTITQFFQPVLTDGELMQRLARIPRSKRNNELIACYQAGADALGLGKVFKERLAYLKVENPRRNRSLIAAWVLLGAGLLAYGGRTWWNGEQAKKRESPDQPSWLKPNPEYIKQLTQFEQAKINITLGRPIEAPISPLEATEFKRNSRTAEGFLTDLFGSESVLGVDLAMLGEDVAHFSLGINIPFKIPHDGTNRYKPVLNPGYPLPCLLTPDSIYTKLVSPTDAAGSRITELQSVAGSTSTTILGVTRPDLASLVTPENFNNYSGQMITDGDNATNLSLAFKINRLNGQLEEAFLQANIDPFVSYHLAKTRGLRVQPGTLASDVAELSKRGIPQGVPLTDAQINSLPYPSLQNLATDTLRYPFWGEADRRSEGGFSVEVLRSILKRPVAQLPGTMSEEERSRYGINPSPYPQVAFILDEKGSTAVAQFYGRELVVHAKFKNT